MGIRVFALAGRRHLIRQLQEREARRLMEQHKSDELSPRARRVTLAAYESLLRETRERFKQHGYEADARECERLLQEIRALDPGFEEAR